MRTARVAWLVVVAACSSGSSGTDAQGDTPLPPIPAGPRASSLLDCGHDGACDDGERCFAVISEGMRPTGSSRTISGGDRRCHRVCDDAQCAPGEACQRARLLHTDHDTPDVPLCQCSAPGCTPPARGPEGGLRLWTLEARLPDALTYHAAAFADGRLFVAGGVAERSGARTRVTEVWFASPDREGTIAGWKVAGALPGPRVDHALAAGSGRLYVSGGDGTTGTSVMSATVRADGELGDWRDERALPEPRRGHQMFHVGSRLILIGGDGEHGFVADVASGGALGEWQRVEDPGVPVVDGSAVVARDRLYAVADRELVSIALTDVRGGAWTRHGEIPVERGGLLFGFHLRGALGFIRSSGHVSTAPVAADGGVGAWRSASRVDLRPVIVEVVVTSPSAVWSIGGAIWKDGRGVEIADVSSASRHP